MKAVRGYCIPSPITDQGSANKNKNFKNCKFNVLLIRKQGISWCLATSAMKFKLDTYKLYTGQSTILI
jgi:hypothetical protein